MELSSRILKNIKRECKPNGEGNGDGDGDCHDGDVAGDRGCGGGGGW